jgi:hypothetical protein
MTSPRPAERCANSCSGNHSKRQIAYQVQKDGLILNKIKNSGLLAFDTINLICFIFYYRFE